MEVCFFTIINLVGVPIQVQSSAQQPAGWYDSFQLHHLKHLKRIQKFNSMCYSWGFKDVIITRRLTLAGSYCYRVELAFIM